VSQPEGVAARRSRPEGVAARREHAITILNVRIVAKVDHLMKLCDELETKLRRAEDRASKLVEAVVGEMVG
jgi:hypothetical protein